MKAPLGHLEPALVSVLYSSSALPQTCITHSVTLKIWKDPEAILLRMRWGPAFGLSDPPPSPARSFQKQTLR